MNDSISDVFTRIRNANLVGHNTVRVPLTLTTKNILNILVHHGFIKNFSQINNREFLVTLKLKSVLRKLKRLSRPGCRLYVSAQNIPQILRSGQLGIAPRAIILLSTSKGILSDREARYLKVGGEILGYVS
uniref:Small ribosomal subunit protein uS8c n=1 Tax=Halimeda minima TaxID=170427 RepID=C0KS35_9CHLO|nr:ribosomal protein S8 [Halimeda minima]ACN23278.1 ribosomal protein S8 [Halimeda minima]AYC64665.1 ribosomal protein S8 [Halimeda minima]